MKEEEPADGRKTEDEGIGKENLAILEKIKKNQRQDYLNVRVAQWAGGLGKQRDSRARVMEALASPPALNQRVPSQRYSSTSYPGLMGLKQRSLSTASAAHGGHWVTPGALVPHEAVLLLQDLGLPSAPRAVPL